MITNGEMAKILEEEAKLFRESKHAQTFLKVWDNETINESIAGELAMLFLSFCFAVSKSGNAAKLKEITRQLLKNILDWAPNAPKNIQRSNWKNPAYGQTAVNQDTFDALLVDYINFVYLPGDLGLLAEHVR